MSTLADELERLVGRLKAADQAERWGDANDAHAAIIGFVDDSLPTILRALRAQHDEAAKWEDGDLPVGPFSYVTTAPKDRHPGTGHVYLIDGHGKKLASIWGSPEQKVSLAEWICDARAALAAVKQEPQP